MHMVFSGELRLAERPRQHPIKPQWLSFIDNSV
jgi:hypothetical protein